MHVCVCTYGDKTENAYSIFSVSRASSSDILKNPLKCHFEYGIRKY